MSEGTGMGSDRRAADVVGDGGFKLLFFDVPMAVLVFLAWAVGESYARERWGERLASFDAILRRDPLNATVGRSLLTGVLLAPAVAAAALAVGAIPLAHRRWRIRSLGGGTDDDPLPRRSGGMRPRRGPRRHHASGRAACSSCSPGRIAAACSGSASSSRRALGAIIGRRRRRRSIRTRCGCSSDSAAVVAAIAIFLALRPAGRGTALFFGIAAHVVAAAALASRAATCADISSIAHRRCRSSWPSASRSPALLTRREVVYTYEDLAPHVKRIVERERVKAEIDAANRIQAALLPLDAPNLAGATVASHYRAATEIGGDYFDFLKVASGEIGIAFGDVSGHGLTSGIVMAMAKSALLVQVDYDSSPRAVLDVLNEIVIKTAPKRIDDDVLLRPARSARADAALLLGRPSRSVRLSRGDAASSKRCRRGASRSACADAIRSASTPSSSRPAIGWCSTATA